MLVLKLKLSLTLRLKHGRNAAKPFSQTTFIWRLHTAAQAPPSLHTSC